MTDDEKLLALNYAWQIGDLRLLLKPIQRRMLDAWNIAKNTGNTEYLFHVGRQTGKSYFLNLTAIERCLRKKRTSIVYIAPVERKLADFVKPILETILETCPESLKPVYIPSANKLQFKNGSVIHYYGVNNENHSNIRGLGYIDLVIDDECGFFTNLIELQAVVSPMLLRSNGQIVYSSSSPETLDHEFWNLVDKAILNNWYFKAPTWEDETVSPQALKALADRLGGEDSSRYRREVGCERIIEKTKQALPEWDSKLYVLSEPDYLVLRRDPNYHGFNHLVSFDPGHGGTDPNCVSFGTYIFGKGILLIEDEIVIPGRDITTDRLVLLIREKIKELWGNSQRVMMWADPSNQTLLNDMSRLHNMVFAWTAKDKKAQAMEELRTFIANSRLYLGPKAIKHKMMYENTIWNDQHTDFEHSSAGYHGDAVDSTLYMHRNINYENPLPPVPPMDIQRQFINPARKKILEEQANPNSQLFDHLAPEDFGDR